MEICIRPKVSAYSIPRVELLTAVAALIGCQIPPHFGKNTTAEMVVNVAALRHGVENFVEFLWRGFALDRFKQLPERRTLRLRWDTFASMRRGTLRYCRGVRRLRIHLPSGQPNCSTSE
ncbi:hypothetical protein VDG1235_2626 [Verrucomicrobiia bacterium DG1235]|nr:hypothetical protein VDG1235_2626 [Verrucomicrobiae bacterium DG1235]